MNDAYWILHFTADADAGGAGSEYVVITDNEAEDHDGYALAGYTFSRKVAATIPDGGMLPVGTVLMRNE